MVQEDVYDEFVERSAARALARTVGSPWDPKNEQGPQVDAEQFEKILGYIKSGKSEGAKCVAGGDKAADKGYYVQVIKRIQWIKKLLLGQIFAALVAALCKWFYIYT